MGNKKSGRKPNAQLRSLLTQLASINNSSRADIETEAAATLHLSLSAVRNVYDRMIASGELPRQRSGGLLPTTGAPKTECNAEYNKKDGTGMVTTRSLDIKTLDAALSVAKVDLKAWEVERYVVNSWEVTIGKNKTDTEKPETYTNFQVKVWLRLIQKTPAQSSLEAVVGKLNLALPRVRLPAPRRHDKTLLEINLADPHFALLAWGKESGEDYDLAIAQRRYIEATADLLHKASLGYRPERILFPLGNDFLHIDNEFPETQRAHHPLDKDGRLAKILEVAETSAIQAITACAGVAPVDVMWVPGNHDPVLSLALCHILRAVFKNNPHVHINVDPPPRKYYRYGATLLGFTHGEDEKMGDLPTIMAAERPEDFGQVKTREFHIGHFHRRKKMQYNGEDSFCSVTVRVVPSISSTDAWHFRQGYVAGNKMADAYLYSRGGGFIGYFTSTVHHQPAGPLVLPAHK